MFLQFSPVKRKTIKKVIKTQESDSEKVTTLSLAPFSPNPKIFFENVVVGDNAIRKLLIKNPNNHDTQLIATASFDEITVDLNWKDQLIKKKSETELVIRWTPKTEGAWRYNLHLNIDRRVQINVPIVFKSILPKQNQLSRTKLKVKRLPSFVSKKTRSPIHKVCHKRSPVKQLLGNTTNIPQVLMDPSNKWRTCNKINKENYKNEAYSFESPFNMGIPCEIRERRNTYTVKTFPEINTRMSNEDNFSDSLEMKSPNASPAKTDVIEATRTPNIESRLQSASFMLSPVMITPRNNFTEFNPAHCSSGEKSINNSHSLQGKQVCLLSSFEILQRSCDNSTKANISTETYVKDNISSETFTKSDISSNTYVKDSSVGDITNLQLSPAINTPQKIEHDSFSMRLESLSGVGVKSIIEANLWSDKKPKKPLITITEEPSFNESSINCSLKRKLDSTFSVTPQKRANLEASRLHDWSKTGRRSLRISKKTTGLNITRNNDEMVEITKKDTNEVIIKDPFLLAAAGNVDPFMVSSIYCHEEWIEKQQENFKKWLNALLTPPLELDSNEDQPVKVMKLWKECKKKDVVIAPTREKVSNEYHTNSRLNSLRKAALVLFRSDTIREVLSNIIFAVENNRLAIRQDKDVHLDLALQSDIMSIIFSYNSLWLRIGLETIYNLVIPLNSNSDLMGLSYFISERFFKDPYLLKKYKSVHSPKYNSEIKKFILKKFLILVYFLDQAKMNKLIPHDPCLFCKNAPIKESRECLLKFSKETLLAVGDITKSLKHLGYVVYHKQTYINEFDYAVNCLGVDLRDGVRLTRVMEIILLKNDLSKSLRVPAISRLQKIHNMEIVFAALKSSGYEILYDISPRDIVDGHKEKTLSFLWQIIYKFEAPLMIKNATVIQQWWRSKPVLVKRNHLKEIRMEKDEAARKIQLWYRKRKSAVKSEQLAIFAKSYLENIQLNNAAVKIQSFMKMYVARKKFLRLRNTVVIIQIYARKWLMNNDYKKRITSAILIQSYIRMLIAKRNFQNIKYATLLIQRRFRAIRTARSVRDDFQKLRKSTIAIQRRFRAIKIAKIDREKFIISKNAAIIIQRRFRANQMMKMQCHFYAVLKQTTVFIQRRFRAKILGRKVRQNYEKLRQATIVIQRRFRANLQKRIIFTQFQLLKKSTILIQQRYRAYQAMISNRNYYAVLKYSVILIQQHYRAKLAMKQQMNNFRRLKAATILIQRTYRGKIIMRTEMRKFYLMKMAAIKIQRWYKSRTLMRKEMDNFAKLKGATVMIQQRYRANMAMRLQMNNFKKLRECVINIQRRYRAKLAMRLEMNKFKSLKNATIFIQRRFRAKIAMKSEMQKFRKLKDATVTIQRHFRSKMIIKQDVTRFMELKRATIVIQRRYKAEIMMKLENIRYMKLKQAVTLVQRRYRANRLMKSDMKNLETLKAATIIVQRRYRAQIAMKTEMEKFRVLKGKVIAIQRWFRAQRAMKQEREKFIQLKRTVITVQRRYRSKMLIRLESRLYDELKHAAVVIQRRYRAKLQMKKEFEHFRNLRKAAIIIQKRYRAKLMRNLEMNRFRQLKRATIVIQRSFRSYLRNKEYEAKIIAVIVIQKHVRRFLVQKKYAEYLTPEAINERKMKKIQDKAAVRIQAVWRGYRSRSIDKPELVKIRERCKKANESAVVTNTLGSRCKNAVLVLSTNPTLLEIISALQDIEFITRRCKETCFKMSTVLTKNLYITICSTCRSLPEMQASTAATQILINFCKYPPSKENSWIPEYIDNLITVMLHWCDKEAPLFPTLCTLIWLFAHDAEHKKHILEGENFQQKFKKIEAACLRKKKMVSKINLNGRHSYFSSYNNLPLPSLNPDWGLDYKSHPKTFCNSLQAFYCLLNILRSN